MTRKNKKPKRHYKHRNIHKAAACTDYETVEVCVSELLSGGYTHPEIARYLEVDPKPLWRHTYDDVIKAAKASGYKSFGECMAKLTTAGLSHTEIAEQLGVKPKRLWAYYGTYAAQNIAPLRLGEPT